MDLIGSLSTFHGGDGSMLRGHTSFDRSGCTQYLIPVVRSFTISPLDSSNEPSHSLRSWETPRDEANIVENSYDRQYSNDNYRETKPFSVPGEVVL
jgi:hypothetical protein